MLTVLILLTKRPKPNMHQSVSVKKILTKDANLLSCGHELLISKKSISFNRWALKQTGVNGTLRTILRSR